MNKKSFILKLLSITGLISLFKPLSAKGEMFQNNEIKSYLSGKELTLPLDLFLDENDYPSNLPSEITFEDAMTLLIEGGDEEAIERVTKIVGDMIKENIEEKKAVNNNGVFLWVDHPYKI